MIGRSATTYVYSGGTTYSNTTTGHFVYDPVTGDMVLAFDGYGNLTNRFLYGPPVDEILAQENVSSPLGANTTWMVTNYQGSVVNSLWQGDTQYGSDPSSNVSYSPFGQTNFAGGLFFGYTGAYTDPETGLQYHSVGDDGRWYSTSAQRWINPDPSGLGPDSNEYRYCGNNPTNETDPTGHELFANGTAATDAALGWITNETGVDAQAIALGNGLSYIIVDSADARSVRAKIDSGTLSNGAKVTGVDRNFYNALLSSQNHVVVSSGDDGGFNVGPFDFGSLTQDQVGTILGANHDAGYNATQLVQDYANQLAQAQAGRGPSMAGIFGPIIVAAPEEGPAAPFITGGAAIVGALIYGYGAYKHRRQITNAINTIVDGLTAALTTHAELTVAEILKNKKGSIKQAPLPPGSPSWGEIIALTWEQIVAGAQAGKPGYKTIKKLLGDKRFNK